MNLNLRDFRGGESVMATSILTNVPDDSDTVRFGNHCFGHLLNDAVNYLETECDKGAKSWWREV